MILSEQQRARLFDRQGRVLGDVTVREVRGRLLFGEFREGPDFAAVAPLFAEHHRAANEQLFSRVDELDEAIEALGLRLQASGGASFTPLRNVSVSEGRITLELSESAAGESSRNGSPARSSAAEGAPTP